MFHLSGGKRKVSLRLESWETVNVPKKEIKQDVRASLGHVLYRRRRRSSEERGVGSQVSVNNKNSTDQNGSEELRGAGECFQTEIVFI